MELHRGQLIDHLYLRAKDLEASKRFYRAALAALRDDLVLHEGEGHFFCDELWVDKADEGGVSRVHLAFQVPDRSAITAG
jgi:catechol 2,3-dioxygenase-like lactoylglutathione lyase family enzyme